ncbi:MAG: N-acetyltransferase [Singulisphaera sp.]
MANTDTVRFIGKTLRIPRNVTVVPINAPPTSTVSQTRPQSPADEQITNDSERTLPQTSLAIVEQARPTVKRSVRQLEVRQVGSQRDLDAFVRFPWQIYAGDRNWSPPLLLDVKGFLNPAKHPFYKHGTAAQFLAYEQGRAVGRVLVSDDPNYNREHGTNVGCFGMFECIDDTEVAGALLDAAAEWLRIHGRTEILGPIDYSTNYPCGLLVDGFDTPQRVMMNHNPPYYARLLESWRLTKAKDLYAWWFADPHHMLEKWSRLADRFAARGGVTVRPISRANFAAEVENCKQIYNQAWEQNWGFVKMTDVEFEHMALELKKYALTDWVLLAEVDGEPAGVCITIPDFNEATGPLNGRLTRCGLPIGLVRLLYNMRHIKTARMMVLGVMEQFRRRGVVEMFVLKSLATGIAHGYTAAELSWTLEDNELINRTIEKVGGQRYKTYRIYEAAI